MLDRSGGPSLSGAPDYTTNVTLAPGVTYRGDLRDGALHGQGTLTASTGVYCGGFSNNMKHGWGRFTATHAAHDSSLMEYEGEWYLDKPSGKCMAAVFAARQRRGVRSASRAPPAHEYYGGMCLDGRPHGEGRLTYGDGRIYEGEFFNGQRSGRGRLTHANGDHFEGTFDGGKLHGSGRAVTHQDTRVFDGTFDGGKKVRGKMLFNDTPGKWYDGEWQNERPHGRGVQQQDNGDMYTGEFVDGKFWGTGEFFYAQHDIRFRGTFVEGRPNGRGTVALPERYPRTGPVQVTFDHGSLTPRSAEAFRVAARSGASAMRPASTAPKGTQPLFHYESDDEDNDTNAVLVPYAAPSGVPQDDGLRVEDDAYGTASFSTLQAPRQDTTRVKEREVDAARAKEMEDEAARQSYLEQARTKQLDEATRRKQLEEEAARAKHLEETKAKQLGEAAKAKQLEEAAKAKQLGEAAKAKQLEEATKAKQLGEAAEAKQLEDATKAKQLEEAVKAKQLEEAAKAKQLEEATKAKQLEEAVKAKRMQDEACRAEEQRKQEEARAAMVLSEPRDVKFANGDLYHGSVGPHKKPEGHGTYKFTDGRAYDGEFHIGQRHGHGTLTQVNGDFYDGAFVEGKQHGIGHAVSHGGTRVFDGTFDGGKKVRGKMLFNDTPGKWYDGEWQNERPHGRGVQQQTNGDTYTGEFADGRYNGDGSMLYASDQRVLKGRFAADRPQGNCVVAYVGGKVVELTYDGHGAVTARKTLHDPAPPQKEAEPPVVAQPAAPKGPQGLGLIKASTPGTVPVVSSGDERSPTPPALRHDAFAITGAATLSIAPVPTFEPMPLAQYTPDERRTAVNERVVNDTDTRLRSATNRFEAEWDMEEELWSTVQDEIDEEEETGKAPPRRDSVVLHDGFYRNYHFSATNVYTGDLKRGMRDGAGRYTCSAYMYQGQYQGDKRHGYGCLKANPNSRAIVTTYEGMWRQDLKEGAVAVATIRGGDKYCGGFRNNVFHGPGRYTYADGRWYEGTFANGLRHGQGVLAQPNGERYEGGFVEGKMSGIGHAVTHGGTREFWGTFADGKKVKGRIVFHDQDGKCYDGEWMHEKPHGRGMMKLSNGDVYRGQLDNGRFHGHGVLYYIYDNKSYVGLFECDKPHGGGVLRNHSDPSKHVSGVWREGKRST